MKKSNRLLALFYRLLMGKWVCKSAFAEEYEINVRSVERDLQTLREVAEEQGGAWTLQKDEQGRFGLTNAVTRTFTAQDVLFICKVLLSSRSLCAEEMHHVIHALAMLFSSDVRFQLKDALKSEMTAYVPPQHGKELLQLHWELNRAMQRRVKVSITYRKVDGEQVRHKVSPIAVISSEYYFYLVGYFDEKEYKYPAFFRVDRIESVEVTAEHYDPGRFSDYDIGKMKQSLQYMYAGQLIWLKLSCSLKVLEAVRDRLPAHHILKRTENRAIIRALVFDEGFWRWALQYGDAIEILEPESMREKMREVADKLTALYGVKSK